MHLHVRQSSGDGHGQHGEIPGTVDLDAVTVVGKQTVEMEYPEERESEHVSRLCPFCARPFDGIRGVMIHLGQIAGTKNHPENARAHVDADACPIARVDDDQNVIEVVDSKEADSLDLSTFVSTDPDRNTPIPQTQVAEFIDWLEADGHKRLAATARARLLY